MNKIVVIDSGYLTHRSIFLWGSQKKKALEKGDTNDPIIASYGYLNSLYSILKRIGIDRSDKVLIACDGRNSWRRAFLKSYKAQRGDYRKSHEEINWELQYHLINKLEKQLHDSTNWNVLQIDNVANFCDLVLTKEGERFEIEKYDIDYSTEYGIESDDIQALVPKVFPDHEVVLVTIDKDINQCLYYENVKIFNPNLKSPTNKAKKGYYVIEEDPLGVIQKKVRLGDKSDNILVDKKQDTSRDVEIREFIINALTLPEFIEKPVISALKDLNWNKQVNYGKLPFQNSLARKFDSIYDKKNIRTFEESIKRHELKIEKDKKKNKEYQEKRKAKKKKEKENAIP